MYPIIRLAKELLIHRRSPALTLDGTHVSHHLCWPWDIDPWMELNNGRALTLFDLGRIPLAVRTGLAGAVRRQGWGMAVAGGSVRYRKRVRAFRRIEMRSRFVGWDARFLYVDQAMWVGGECANQVLLRMAVTGPGGIVPPAELAKAMGADPASPPLPTWVAAWIEAEAVRPWPPQR